jgi:hypothetical protein
MRTGQDIEEELKYITRNQEEAGFNNWFANKTQTDRKGKDTETTTLGMIIHSRSLLSERKEREGLEEIALTKAHSL